jgi:hypothetical protein
VGAWLETLTGSAGAVLARLEDVLPALAAAGGLILLGWLVGRGLRAWVVRLLDVIEQRFLEKTRRFVAVDPAVDRRASEVIGSVVFWVVFVLFLAAATDALGLPVLSTWLAGLSQFLPRLLLATIIVLAGVLAGRLARDTVAAAVTAGGLAFGRALGRATQIAIVVAAVVTAVDQVGIDSGFFTSATLITIGALLGGTALAFGFGARTSAGNIIALHYVRQRYRVGQTIRIGDVRGVITEIGTTEVVVDTDDAHVQVPGHHFARRAAAIEKSE